MNEAREAEIKKLITGAFEQHGSLEHCVLTITPDLLNEFSLNEPVMGMPVELGTALAVVYKEKTAAAPTPSGEVDRRGMVYWFKDRDGSLFCVNETTAWDLYTSDGSWKMRHPYVGASKTNGFVTIKKAVQEEFPISDEIYDLINTGKQNPDVKRAERDMQVILNKRKARMKEMMADFEKNIDRTIKPPNKAFLFADKVMDKKQQELARDLTKNRRT